MKRSMLWMAAAVLFLAAGSAMAADTATVTVTAMVTPTCQFVTNTATLDFGTLDQTSGNPGTAATSVQFWCTTGATASFTDQGGLHDAGGSKRIQHATVPTAFIPYTMTLTPSGTAGAGPGSPLSLAIAGNINFVDYQNATGGNYSDTVTIDVNP